MKNQPFKEGAPSGGRLNIPLDLVAQIEEGDGKPERKQRSKSKPKSRTLVRSEKKPELTPLPQPEPDAHKLTDQLETHIDTSLREEKLQGGITIPTKSPALEKSLQAQLDAELARDGLSIKIGELPIVEELGKDGMGMVKDERTPLTKEKVEVITDDDAGDEHNFMPLSIRPPKRDAFTGQHEKRSPIQNREVPSIAPQRNEEATLEEQKVRTATNFSELINVISLFRNVLGKSGKDIALELQAKLDEYETNPNNNRTIHFNFLPKYLGIQAKAIELFALLKSEESSSKISVVEKIENEVSTFDVDKTFVDNPEFLEYISAHPEFESMTEKPALAEKLFHAFQVKEEVKKGLDEMIKDEKTLAKDELEKVRSTIDASVLEKPETVIELNRMIIAYKKNQVKIAEGEALIQQEEEKVKTKDRIPTAETQRLELAQYYNRLVIPGEGDTKLQRVWSFLRHNTFRSALLADMTDMLRGQRSRFGESRFHILQDVKKVAREKEEMGYLRSMWAMTDVISEKIEASKIKPNISASLEEVKSETEQLKQRYTNLRRSVLDASGASAVIREVMKKKLNDQLHTLLNPGAKKKSKNITLQDVDLDKAQEFLESLATEGSPYVKPEDVDEIGTKLDAALEKSILLKLTNLTRMIEEGGASKVRELKEVLISLLDREKTGSKDKEKTKLFVIETLKSIDKKIIPTGTPSKKFQKASVRSFINVIEEGKTLS